MRLRLRTIRVSERDVEGFGRGGGMSTCRGVRAVRFDVCWCEVECVEVPFDEAKVRVVRECVR